MKTSLGQQFITCRFGLFIGVVGLWNFSGGGAVKKANLKVRVEGTAEGKSVLQMLNHGQLY